MRISIIPAEITSVEDKIFANLNMKQVVMVVIPFIFSLLMYFLLPNFSRFNAYKIILSFCILSICLFLSIRIKSVVMLDHLLIRSSYLIRPKIYLSSIKTTKENGSIEEENKPELVLKNNSSSHFIDLNNFNKNSVFFITRKGDLNVRISEK